MDGTAITLLAYGFVNEDGFLGGDLDVVNAARVSFAKRSTTLDEAGIGLINFLMRERHGTPFENGGTFRFHVKCPIFVAREWFRHRMSSFNEWSGRYSKLVPEFYVPYEGAYTQVGKPGAYSFAKMDASANEYLERELRITYQSAWNAYEAMLDAEIAKELARAVLPVGIYTEFIWTVNARSLMNFLSLRTAPTAQQAIREYATEAEFIFKATMPHTYAAWLNNGRIAP